MGHVPTPADSVEEALQGFRDDPDMLSIFELDRIGPYKLLEKLGEGGMGVVYLAEQTTPIRRQVAVKFIKPGMDSREVLARFESERQALAMMNHPNIASVIDGGMIESGRSFFVLEYVPGLPLDEYCDQEKLNVSDRIALMVRVCSGVQHAHQKGIIHRDLKPSNILVMERDGEAVPKIIDFGVAKATHSRLTERTLHTGLGKVLGTPGYISPEVAVGSTREIDTRADIYSLGVILYELMVGVGPHDPAELEGMDPQALAARMLDHEPVRPSRRLSELRSRAEEAGRLRGTDAAGLQRRVRDDIDWIVTKALQPERRHRYPSASELQADLDRHLRGDIVLAGAPGAGYRLSRLMRRNRALFLGAAVVLLVLIAGLVTSTTLHLQGARRLREVNRLADARKLEILFEQAEHELWPAHPTKAEPMQEWLDKAHELLGRFAVHEASLSQLRSRATPVVREANPERKPEPGRDERAHRGLGRGDLCARGRRVAMAPGEGPGHGAGGQGSVASVVRLGEEGTRGRGAGLGVRRGARPVAARSAHGAAAGPDQARASGDHCTQGHRPPARNRPRARGGHAHRQGCEEEVARGLQGDPRGREVPGTRPAAAARTYPRGTRPRLRLVRVPPSHPAGLPELARAGGPRRAPTLRL